MECDSRGAEAGGAGKAAAGGASGCAAAADQSALFVQHAELDHVAGAVATGAGAGDDREAGEYSARAAEGPGGVPSVEGGAAVYGRLSGHRGGAFWQQAEGGEGDCGGDSGCCGAGDAATAADREQHQAWPGAADQWWNGDAAKPDYRRRTVDGRGGGR